MRVTIEIPDDLHRKLKEYAVDNRQTIREVVICALEQETASLGEQELSRILADSQK